MLYLRTGGFCYVKLKKWTISETPITLSPLFRLSRQKNRTRKRLPVKRSKPYSGRKHVVSRR